MKGTLCLVILSMIFVVVISLASDSSRLVKPRRDMRRVERKWGSMSLFIFFLLAEIFNSISFQRKESCANIFHLAIL